MKKNDIIRLEISDTGIQGEGIGRYNGMPFFVPDTCPGDIILAGITKLKKNYGYARLIELESASSDRVEPPCPLSKKCGGCSLMHMSYQRQVEWKGQQVYNALLRIGGIDKIVLDRTSRQAVGMENPLHYRNKSQYPVGQDNNSAAEIGFYAARSHRIIPLFGVEKKQGSGCLIANELDAEIIPVLLDYIERTGASSYDEKTGRGLLRHVLIRHAVSTKQTMVCLVVNGERLPEEDMLCELLERVDGVCSVVLNENSRRDNVILGEKTRLLFGAPKICDEILGNKFRISARSFYQVNPVQTEKIYKKAIDYAGLTGRETVWDVYCGIGTISLCLARYAKRVLGIEIIPDAVLDAKENARENGIDNALFVQGSAEELNDIIEEKELYEFSSPDVIVVDPPRKGLDGHTINLILKTAPERIVYVSCNPATLARDLKELLAAGYALEEYTPFDAFCFSGHVETVVLMSRAKD